ncbi:hypothetical protein DFH07DRAFT_911829 [Mycena maculata]|uniref:F-box domain-containing protein n=1 Tax=Mycena maculata TaxID=230809 RepID=A0AAD7K2G8_9AGAR|nr:hypothetical protein DFH07DRAFT_911829 [Mycena maculata]
MHRALEIPEIVQMICVYLSWHRSALAALARTCQAFQGPGLDLLWHTQKSFKPLLCCIPADLFDFNDGDTSTLRAWALRRPIMSADWARLISNTARIRDFTIGLESEGRRILPTLRRFLPGGLLFQNLKTLGWFAIDSAIDFKYIQMFFSPTLSGLTFGCGPSIANISLLSALAYTCPKLRQVSIDLLNDYEGVAGSTVIYSLPRIESLSMGRLTLAGLEYIGRLPTLKSLCLESLPVIPDVVPSSDLFPALRDLELHGIDVTSAPQFFRMYSEAPLKSIHVSSSVFLPSPAADDLLLTITNSTSHSGVTSIKLESEGGNYMEVLGRDPDDSTFALRDRTLRILFCFSNITSLSLESARGFDISDVTIADAAQAWPRLESLELTTASQYTPVPLMLLSLYHLARYCSHLRSLEMTFDATTIPSTAVPVVTQQQLISMDVASSPLANSGAVARFLSDIFPNLRTITALREHADNEDLDELATYSDEVARHNRWKAVVNLIPEFVATREEERARGRTHDILF